MVNGDVLKPEWDGGKSKAGEVTLVMLLFRCPVWSMLGLFALVVRANLGFFHTYLCMTRQRIPALGSPVATSGNVFRSAPMPFAYHFHLSCASVFERFDQRLPPTTAFIFVLLSCGAVFAKTPVNLHNLPIGHKPEPIWFDPDDTV